MDETKHAPAEDPRSGAAMSRRVFFGRALGVAGATAALLALTGCPGGDGDGDDEDEDDDDD